MRALALVLAAGCASFEDPTIVLDLRVLGMEMQPSPERVIELDLQGPAPTVDDVLTQLRSQPTPRVCALVADPATTRDLRFSMTVCLLDEDGARCDPDRPQILVADGEVLYDPEVWDGGNPFGCADVPVDGAFVNLLFDSLRGSPGSAIAGVDFAVEMRVGRQDEHPERDVFAIKKGRVSARIPETRQANRNPQISELQIAQNGIPIFVGGERPCSRPFGDLPEIDSGDVVTLYPLEFDDTRETYELATIDGDFLAVTETISYQWLTTRGEFSSDTTGGPPDLLGNETLLGTDWQAPAVSSLTDIPIWVIQRDERYGVSWWETCIRVVP